MGVLSAEVNLATEMAEVQIVGGDAVAQRLIDAVEKAGYHAAPATEPGGAAVSRGPAWWPIALAAVLSAPLTLPMFGPDDGLRW